MQQQTTQQSQQQRIKIAVNGVAGRMGKAIARAIDDYSDMIIAHAYDSPESSEIAERVCDVGNSKSSTVIAPSTTIKEGNFDVLIDFSTPSSVMNAVQCCLEVGQPLVIGVTGFDDKQKEQLQISAKEIPILISPNMSIGVNLCFKLLEHISRSSWGRKAKINIIETHHKAKKDKPSGTALRMGEIIAKQKGIDLSDLAIESYREGEIMGEHRVFFNSNRERIEIRHEALDRSSFAKGALYAARWLVQTQQKAARIYTMYDVIDDLSIE